MAARPPKLSAWSEKAVLSAPGTLQYRPTVPTSWQYFCGALGYWLPHALNESATYRAQIRMLR